MDDSKAIGNVMPPTRVIKERAALVVVEVNWKTLHLHNVCEFSYYLSSSLNTLSAIKLRPKGFGVASYMKPITTQAKQLGITISLIANVSASLQERQVPKGRISLLSRGLSTGDD